MGFNEYYFMSAAQLQEASISDAKKKLNKIIDSFKLDTEKGKTTMIQSFMMNLVKTDPYQLINEIPTIGEFVRTVIFIGIPIQINPLIGIFTGVAYFVAKNSVDAKLISGYVKSYNKQLDAARNKLEKCKNADKKKDLERHIKDLEDAVEKLESKEYELKDPDQGIIHKTLKDKNEEKLYEACKLLEIEYYQLSEEQKILLFDPDDEYALLNEGAIDTAKKEVKLAKFKVKAKIRKMDNWFNKELKDIRNSFETEREEDLIEDNFPKLSKMLTRAITIGATWAINPALAVVTAAVTYVLSKRGTDKQRKRLLRELNNKLELTEEKIKDADSSNDKKQKYQLMKTRTDLQHAIDKLTDKI